MLSIIETEKELREGELNFVCHSKGGLLVGYLLLKAAEKGHRSDIAAGIVSRTRKVVYLGTPHRGSVIADWFPRVLLPSLATTAMRTNDPHLRSLNQSSREIFVQQKIQCLTFTETKKTKRFFQVVSQDSGDPGFLGDVIPVDEDHISICKPQSRDSHVYRALLDFLERPSNKLDTAVNAGNVLQTPITEIGRLLETAGETETGNPLVDKEVERRVQIIRRGRFFSGAKTRELVEKLCDELRVGNLKASSKTVKGRAFAFCARMLAANDETREHGRSALQHAVRLLDADDDIIIAQSSLEAYDGDLDKALSTLASIDSPRSRGVALRLIGAKKGIQAARTWLSQTGLDDQNLDAEGKSLLLQGDLEEEHWDAALVRADKLSEADFDDAPVLLNQAANAYLAQLVPDENKAFIVEQLPLQAADFSLSSDRGREWARAVEMLRRSASVLMSLGLYDAANYNEDIALWLDLRNSDTDIASQARGVLAESVRTDRKSLLRRLHLIVAFGIPFDFTAVTEQIDNETALTGGRSHEAAMARFALIFAIPTAREAADYLGQHLAQISTIVDKKVLLGFEIQLRAKAGDAESAKALFKELKLAGVGRDQELNLSSIIEEAGGADPLEVRRRSYEKTGAIADLANLIVALEASRDAEQLIPYAKTMFERTKDRRDGERLVAAYTVIKDHKSILEFFAQHPAYGALSPKLLWSRAWALCESGMFSEAKDTIEPLLEGGNRPIRDLHVEIGIASGDWESLTIFVEKEWSKRKKRSPGELLRAAELAFRLGLQRAKPLAIAAAELAKEDPAILIGCYHLATQAGWERDPETVTWLPRAAELSKSDGPVQRFSIREILEMKPEWDARQNETWQQMLRGEMPLFAAALATNRPLASLTLLSAVANLTEKDVRKRGAVFAFAGSRKVSEIKAKVVGFDVTATFNLGLLGLLDTAIEHFDRVVLPHGTLTWLWNEAGRVAFHQPNRVRDAEHLALLTARGAVEQFKPTIAVDPLLATDVGDDLAEMLTHADAAVGQVSVVRSGPLHQVSSLMEAEADLGKYRYLLSGCKDVIDALVEGGQLTHEAASKAVSYLSLNEKSWERIAPLALGQTLYLDDLTVSTFQHLQVLELVAANFNCIVPKIGSRLSENLLEYQALTNRVLQILGDARESIRKGLENGKVVVAGRGLDAVSSEQSARSQPSIELLTLKEIVDAVVIDDRSVNRFQEVNDHGSSLSTCTTLDLLGTLRSGKAISVQKYRESLTTLRQAGYLFIPVELEELGESLSSADIYEKRRETAELRAIRESVVKARMMSVLQPAELYWLEDLSRSAIELISRELLSNETAEGVERAAYLWDMIDAKGWAHCFKDHAVVFAQFSKQQMLLLIISAAQNGVGGARIRVWLDDILSELKTRDGELYSQIVEMAERLIYNYADTNKKVDR